MAGLEDMAARAVLSACRHYIFSAFVNFVLMILDYV